MVTKRGKQASRKAAARKYGFLAVPLTAIATAIRSSCHSGYGAGAPIPR
ncbi:MAG: hypothetical protein Q8K59_13455 [Nitrosomonas sp.]|nr:hypothetical protein [Nitrosomonas sp.]MDP1952063.1 hypothetical protein [Nitrosomonas sp.]